jgi:hypothetical protein
MAKCAQCGISLEDDADFCTGCGGKLESPKKASSAGTWLSRLSMLAVVLGIGVIGYLQPKPLKQIIAKFGPSDSIQTPAATPSSYAAPPPSQPSSTTAIPPTTPSQPPRVTTPPSGPSLDDFQGAWAGEEGKVLKLVREGDSLVSMPDKEIQLSFMGKERGSTLHGTYSSGPESMPVSAELSADRRSITFTLAPANSEYMVSTMKKVDEDEIPGIEKLHLEKPEVYLPLVRSKYRYDIKYPDGDEGPQEVFVGNFMGQTTTSIAFSQSKLYPGEPSVFTLHYVERPDGIYAVSDLAPTDGGLWLPNDLRVGKSWRTPGGNFEVVDFDTQLDVGQMHFTGVLVLRHQNDEVDMDEKIYIAPGYGEILVKDNKSDFVWQRFVEVEPADPQRLAELSNQHAPNLEQIR